MQHLPHSSTRFVSDRSLRRHASHFLPRAARHAFVIALCAAAAACVDVTAPPGAMASYASPGDAACTSAPARDGTQGGADACAAGSAAGGGRGAGVVRRPLR